MTGFNDIFVLLSVFGVMLMAVQVLPPIFSSWRERQKDQTQTLVRRSGWNPTRFKPVTWGVGALGLGVAFWWVSESWMPLGLLIIAAIFGPRLLDRFQQERRTRQFDSQLLDGLILINNALKSGLDIVTGIELITSNMRPPISEEFGQALNAYRLGTPLEQALRDMTQRIPSRGLETAVSSIVIQRETGGNLVRTFEQLIVTIRDESKLQQKIQAISAQGRTQISILAFFPWIIAAVFFTITPDTMKAALHDPMGQIVLAGLILWECIGLLMTKKIITVDV